ncbi:MAG: CopD family protein [Chitinophagales bacterium]
MYNYIKALHIIFIVTWFSGMFYIVRLFIYNREAQDMNEPEKSILGRQFGIMIRRLWLGITWPSAVLTLIFGIWTWYLMGSSPQWLVLKLLFVIGLYAYHFSLHFIYDQQVKGRFKFSSQQLRIWNEVATIFLFLVVFMAVGKGSISLPRILIGLIVLIMILMLGINLYKRLRQTKGR